MSDADTFAFIIHPIDPKSDVARKYPLLGKVLSEGQINFFSRFFPPVYISEISGMRSAATGREARGWFIACPFTPKTMLSLPVETVYRKFGAPLDEHFDRENRPWEMDDAPVLAARRQIAAKVQYLLHPDKYEDPEAPAVSDEVAWSEEMPDAAGSEDSAPVQDHGMPEDAASQDVQLGDVAAPADSGSTDPGAKGNASSCAAGPRGDAPGPASLLLLVLAASGLVARRRSCAAER